MQNNEYISRFSHELRNPLTLIYSSLQLLEKECPAVRESELWEQIRKDMLDVIQLLKDMSAPFGRLQPAPVDIREFLSGLSASFAPSMEMRGIRFITEAPDSLSGLVLTADQQKLRQAITNLLLNAADAVSARSLDVTRRPAAAENASDSETVAVREDASVSAVENSPAPGVITLSAESDGTSLSIHVRDNGPGIPQNYLADLFEPFVTHKQGGTGLGLSVARIIAEQHGGKLSVETCCDGMTYTDFCLQLPLSGCPQS